MRNRIRESILVAVALALALLLGLSGRHARALLIAGLGLAGALAVALADGRERRWPRLRRRLGRTLRAADERLWPLLDAAEDALVAIAVDGRGFQASLRPVDTAAADLARRALALGRIRAGHEDTLARLTLEPSPTPIELEARAEAERLTRELEQLRRALADIGPSVRHLRLLADESAAGVHAGESPLEIESRLTTLRHALAEELHS